MKWILTVCVLSLAAVSQAQIPSVIVLQPPENVDSFVAHTVRVSCAAYGSPLPATIWWTGPSGNITSGGKVKIYTKMQTLTGGTHFRISTLEICGLSTTDSGKYTCIASDNGINNSVGNSWASTTLTVIDEDAAPPAMVVVPPAMATVNLWDNMQMMCVAYGNPLPSIIWSGPTCADITDKNCSVSDNVTVQSTTVGYGDLWFAQSVLQFCSIAEEGTYSCYASNGLTGTGLAAPSASISVTVIPPPEPPTEPSPSPSTATSSKPARTETTQTPTTRGPTDDTILGIASETAYLAFVGILAVIAAILLLVLIIECFIFCNKRRINRKFDPSPVHMYSSGDGSATINYILGHREHRR